MMKAKLLEHKFSYSLAPRNEQKKKGFSMFIFLWRLRHCTFLGGHTTHIMPKNNGVLLIIKPKNYIILLLYQQMNFLKVMLIRQLPILFMCHKIKCVIYIYISHLMVFFCNKVHFKDLSHQFLEFLHSL